jgi:nucleoside-diphosphate-sugar epimerase
MNLANQTIAITGANGFVGSALTRFLADRGATVRALVRDPSKHRDLCEFARGGVYQFNLSGAMDDEALKGPVRAVIHCAYVIDGGNRNEKASTNIDGTRDLLRRSRTSGVDQIVFVSSMAAHQRACSSYGKSKGVLEQDIEAGGGTIIKPGTVIGPGGVFQRLREIVRKVPLLPVFYADHNIQTVFIDDLCRAVESSIIRRARGRLIAAEGSGVSLRGFYRGLVELEQRRTPTFAFPGDLALMFAKAADALSLSLPITADNLLGIKHIQHFDNSSSVKTLGVDFRDYQTSLSNLAQAERQFDSLAEMEEWTC